MRTSRVMLVVAAVLSVIALARVSVAAPPAPQFARQDLYLVSAFDAARDPEADLSAATDLARSSGRNILLDVGGDWCVWCHILDRYLADHRDVGDAFAKSFVIVKVNWSPENQNKRFLSRFPDPSGYPHFYVLDPDGVMLASQDTSKLEQRESYNRRKMLAFAKQWLRE